MPRGCIAAVLCVLANAGSAHAGGWPIAPALGANGGVTWSRAPYSTASVWGSDSVALAAWAAAPHAPMLAPVAARVRAERLAAAGDTLRADSMLARAEVTSSVWALRALRLRVQWALGMRDTTRAARLLDTAERSRWPEADRATWLADRSRLALAMRDTAHAVDLAQQVIRVYPSLGPAGASLNMLESVARVRGDSLSVADERTGAEVDYFRAMRQSAAARLRRVLPRVEVAERWRVQLRLAEVLRESRSPKAARAAADAAWRLAPDPPAAVRAQLERARALRDGAVTDSALALYRRIARSAAEPAQRAIAWWELAREAQDRSRWAQAKDAFLRVLEAGDRRAEEARFLAGLMAFVGGEPDSARALWQRGTSEASRFWYGVSLRSLDRAASDSVLTRLARAPGYGFYRAAARETLGVRGWPGTVAAAACEADTACEVLSAVAALDSAGLPDDAAFLLSRWAASDQRLVPTRHRASVPIALQATRLAYAAGNTATGTRYSERAFVAAGEDDSLAWSMIAWAYPPPFEASVVAAETLGVERALLWALMRQESRFDPRARSRSDALGLAQLKLGTAGDVARWLHDPEPTVERLFEPDLGVRYGARYLQWLLQRFDGQPAVALAAYNAGPGTIRRDWRELLARGGTALFCELASNADSQDYARRILGMRQAYRELRPTTAP